MAHVACRDHGFDLSSKQLLESRDQINLEPVGILEDLRVEQDLVGLAEAKLQLVLVKELFVRLYDGIRGANTDRIHCSRIPLLS